MQILQKLIPFSIEFPFLFVFVESLFCFVFQNGDCVTMEKPIPCKKTMIKMSNEEFVQRMSVNNIAISILTKCGNCNTLFYFSHLMEQQLRMKIVDHFYFLNNFYIDQCCSTREIGGKVFLNKFLLHHSGFTKITSIEVF